VSFDLTKQKSSGGFKQPLLEVGTAPARLVRIIDLGIQPQQAFEGKDKPPAHMVDWTWELVDVFMVDKDGNEDESKPRWISEQFPLHNPKADLAKSTKRCNAVDPDKKLNYQMDKYIGLPAMVTIGHKVSKGNTYANVLNVGPMRPKDIEKCPELKNEPVVFTLDEPDMEIFKSFPDWLKERIMGNLEFKGSKLDKALNGDKASEPEQDEQEPENGEQEAW